MAKKDVHIVPRPSGWAVQRAGGQRATAVTNTKAEADKIGRTIAKRDGVELVTHGKNGRIQDSDSFGRDPNPPRDKKH